MYNKLTKILSVLVLIGSFGVKEVYAKAAPEGFADIVKPLIPAVVNISTTQKISKRSHSGRGVPLPFPEGSPLEEFNQFFERFGLPSPNEKEKDSGGSRPVSLGSGFIIDSSGYIVTNNHVIADADEITVTLSSGEKLKASVVGKDKKTDIALLKVQQKKPLPHVKFGDSDKSQVGDWVIAIGNPFGLGGSVTAGIISAHERDIHPDGLVDNFIQADVAINQGNSGGPMFNMNGEVVGINTAILSPVGLNIGIGFATPSSVAQIVVKQLKDKGKVERGMLGIRIQQINEEIADSLGVKAEQGALVVEVAKNSAAEKSGVKVGDIITKFDGQNIDSVRKLSRIVAEAALNKSIELDIIRDGKKLKLNVLLAPEKEQKPDEEEVDSSTILGAEMAPLTPRLRGKFNIEENIEGLVILEVDKNSIWRRKGFMPGDVIISADQKKLKTQQDLMQAIKKAKRLKKKSILLLVSRKSVSMFIPLDIRKKK